MSGPRHMNFILIEFGQLASTSKPKSWKDVLLTTDPSCPPAPLHPPKYTHQLPLEVVKMQRQHIAESMKVLLPCIFIFSVRKFRSMLEDKMFSEH